ncbi:hypothetical protein OHB11_33620 [Streptomyces zaomyceticus]|nr:hypothetical protein OG237_06780 [Streptomyces zaomyceticus]
MSDQHGRTPYDAPPPLSFGGPGSPDVSSVLEGGTDEYAAPALR